MNVNRVADLFRFSLIVIAMACLGVVRACSQSSPPEQKNAPRTAESHGDESVLGPGDLLDIAVFEAPEMNRTIRVSANGEIALQMLAPIRASGLTPRELEAGLQDQLRRTYMKDPHVGVAIKDLQSHPVSVVGAVKQPGVYQIQGTKSVIEMLSMAQGITEDAGLSVLIIRGAGLTGSSAPSASEFEKIDGSGSRSAQEINLKELLESRNSSLNVPVHPGDIVKVTRAGIVYVVGEVRKPGGFVLRNNENVSVLQALALAEGLTRTSAKDAMRIIRTDPDTEKRIEIPVDLRKVLSSKAPDLMLQSKDIVFVPNSTGKAAFYRGAEAALVSATGVAIYGRY